MPCILLIFNGEITRSRASADFASTIERISAPFHEMMPKSLIFNELDHASKITEAVRHVPPVEIDSSRFQRATGVLSDRDLDVKQTETDKRIFRIFDQYSKLRQWSQNERSATCVRPFRWHHPSQLLLIV